MSKSATNFKNKKNRSNLYERTFMKNNLESRLMTLQQSAAKLGLHTTAFALDMNQANYEEFSEAIGDVETMIELAKYSIEPLQETSMNSKHGKLQRLKDRTDESDLKRISEIQAEKEAKEIEVNDPEEIKNPPKTHEGGTIKKDLDKERLIRGTWKVSKPEKTFLQKLCFWNY